MFGNQSGLIQDFQDSVYQHINKELVKSESYKLNIYLAIHVIYMFCGLFVLHSTGYFEVEQALLFSLFS